MSHYADEVLSEDISCEETLLAAWSTYYLTLKMEGVYSSETSASFYQTKRHHIQKIVLFIITLFRPSNFKEVVFMLMSCHQT
jgi:hypothetical protein